MKEVAIELEANKGSSEVMRKMVDRLMIRKAELAKQRKSLQGTDPVLLYVLLKIRPILGIPLFLLKMLLILLQKVVQ